MSDEKTLAIPSKETISSDEAIDANEIISRLEERRLDSYVIEDCVIPCVVGIDPEKELSASGWSCFLLPLANNNGDIGISGSDGQPIDLAALTAPLSITEVSKLEFNGKSYRLGRDAWGNPSVYKNKEEENVALNPKFTEALQKSVQLWEAALEGEDSIYRKVQELYGDEAVEIVSGLTAALEENPGIQRNRYWAEAIDLWDLAYKGKTVEGALKLLNGENGGIRKPYGLEKTKEFDKCITIIKKIIAHQPLTEKERYFLDALKMSRIALRKSIREMTTWGINEFSRPYVIANIVENLICREAIGWDVYEVHQQHFQDFSSRLYEDGYEVPSWFTSYSGNEFLWSFALDGTIANAAGHYFIESSTNKENVAHVLDHERGHSLRSETDSIGQSTRFKKEKAEGRQLPYERYDESFTESLALLVRSKGDVAKALEDNSLQSMSYKNGVEQLLLIIQEIQEVSGDQLLGSKLLIDGYKLLADGESWSQTDALRTYYDKQIAQRDGAFDERMDRYADTKIIRVGWRGESSSEHPDASHVVEVAKSAIIGTQWEDLTEDEKKGFWKGIEGFEEAKQDEIKWIVKNPLILLDLQPSVLIERAFRAIQSNQETKMQFKQYISVSYREYLQALNDVLKTGERKKFK